MSSHHFVKEGQEPSLFIVDPVPFSTVEHLLEWAPFVLVAGTALQEVLSWGIKIDAVICSDDAIAARAHQLAVTQPLEVVTTQGPLLQDGVTFLHVKNQRNVNIIVEAAARYLDTFSSSDAEQLVFLDPVTRWVPVATTFGKWVPVNTAFLIHPPTMAETIRYSGLEKENNRFISSKDGLVSFSAASFFWLGEVQ